MLDVFTLERTIDIEELLREDIFRGNGREIGVLNTSIITLPQTSLEAARKAHLRRREMLEQMTREELLEEIAFRDEVIDQLKKEIDKYRAQAQKARRVAISAESDVSSEYLSFPKSQEVFDLIDESLASNDFMRHLDAVQRERVATAMTPINVKTGSVLCRQGDAGNLMYVIQEGTVHVYVDGQLIRVMEAGALLGELAILHHCERTATVKAVKPCTVWAIERGVFHTIMVLSAQEQRELNRRVLKWTKRFSDVPDDSLLRLADLCVEARYEEEGDEVEIEPNFVYVVVSGVVIAERGREVRRYKSYDDIDVQPNGYWTRQTDRFQVDEAPLVLLTMHIDQVCRALHIQDDDLDFGRRRSPNLNQPV